MDWGTCEEAVICLDSLTEYTATHPGMCTHLHALQDGLAWGPWRLLVASRNRAKAAEILEVLKAAAPDLHLTVTCLEDHPEVKLPPEGRTDFRSNAMEKAQAAAVQSGLVSLADDSGLEVAYLGGLPGPMSARFAGEGARDEDNNRKLLSLLRGVPPELRRATFRCSVAVALPSGWVQVVDGSCDGLIAEAPKGNNGFGYDPLFYYPPAEKTFGEMTPAEKHTVSHRGAALRKAVPLLRQILRA